MIGFYITNQVSNGVVDTIYPDRDASKMDYVSHFNNKRWVSFDKGVAFDKFFAVDISHFNVTDREARAFKNLDKFASEEKIIDGFNAKMKAMTNNFLFLNIFINEIA